MDETVSLRFKNLVQSIPKQEKIYNAPCTDKMHFYVFLRKCFLKRSALDSEAPDPTSVVVVGVSLAGSAYNS